MKSGDPLPDNAALEKLFESREERIRPHLDDKILVSWNGMMITALTLACRVTGDVTYLESAQEACGFLLENLRTEDGGLLRSYREGPGVHRAQSDDYAQLIEACLNLYQTDFNEKWFSAARDLQAKQDELFWDAAGGGYFDNDGRDPLLIMRNKSFEDGVVPSANSVSVSNLLALSDLTGDLTFRGRAEKILHAASVYLERYPQGVAKLIHSIDKLTDKSAELAIVSPVHPPLPTHSVPASAGMTGTLQAVFRDAPKLMEFLWKDFNPNVTVAAATSSSSFAVAPRQNVPLLKDRPAVDEKATFYLCRNSACELPSNDQTAIIAQLGEKETYRLN